MQVKKLQKYCIYIFRIKKNFQVNLGILYFIHNTHVKFRMRRNTFCSEHEKIMKKRDKHMRDRLDIIKTLRANFNLEKNMLKSGKIIFLCH